MRSDVQTGVVVWRQQTGRSQIDTTKGSGEAMLVCSQPSALQRGTDVKECNRNPKQRTHPFGYSTVTHKLINVCVCMHGECPRSGTQGK